MKSSYLKEEGRRKKEEGRGKREEGRGKREEGRRKREEESLYQLYYFYSDNRYKFCSEDLSPQIFMRTKIFTTNLFNCRYL
ncbi:hypothetical protein [Microcoleus vaginatus]|uniref:hypothetical protein n=1 Tax=Microcoleus vaginatus TaxID=119532 RepID=UPI001F60457A|nr:hypothetical protein D0A37_16295 [Microcoleus vaginatus HSN003]